LTRRDLIAYHKARVATLVLGRQAEGPFLAKLTDSVVPEDSAADFGAYLRQARERRGVSLRQIAATTKISLPALEALERNNISRLPGGIFTRAFVRAYAREVGLDPERTVREFVARFPQESVTEGSTYPPETHEDLDKEKEKEHSRLRGVFRVVGVVVPVLLAITYFGFSDRLWKWSQNPAPVTRAEKTGAASEAGPPRAAAASPIPPALDSTPPVPAPSDVGSAAQPGTPSDAGILSANQPPAAVDENGLRITLSPRGACWVWVQVDGVEALAELLQAGDERELRAREEILLKVGDAGALAFAINGVAGRALGAAGAVVTARITPQNYKTYLVSQD
jgi:cytoskeleton protein RodZ